MQRNKKSLDVFDLMLMSTADYLSPYQEYFYDVCNIFGTNFALKVQVLFFQPYFMNFVCGCTSKAFKATFGYKMFTENSKLNIIHRILIK